MFCWPMSSSSTSPFYQNHLFNVCRVANPAESKLKSLQQRDCRVLFSVGIKSDCDAAFRPVQVPLFLLLLVPSVAKLALIHSSLSTFRLQSFKLSSQKSSGPVYSQILKNIRNIDRADISPPLLAISRSALSYGLVHDRHHTECVHPTSIRNFEILQSADSVHCKDWEKICDISQNNLNPFLLRMWHRLYYPPFLNCRTLQILQSRSSFRQPFEPSQTNEGVPCKTLDNLCHI